MTWRRRALALLDLGGLASALFLLTGMVATPIEVVPIGHLEYRSPHFFLPVSPKLYLAATTLGLGLSSLPLIRWFGVLAMASAGLAYPAYARWFISVWCFFAAVLSVMVYLALARHRNAAAQPSHLASLPPAHQETCHEDAARRDLQAPARRRRRGAHEAAGPAARVPDRP